MWKPVLVTAAFITSSACGNGDSPSGPTASPTPLTDPAPLRDAAATAGKLLGAAIQAGFLDEAAYNATLSKHFSYVTAEYEMKWDPVQRQPGVYEFAAADRIVAFAEARGMRVRGHALVWHGATPAWVGALSAPELRIAVEDHIRTVAGRYRGRIYAWDVVNEAVADDGQPSTEGLRHSVFLQRLGPGYIADAFRRAREADPEAKLYYNDYAIEWSNAKFERTYALVKGLVDTGVPIDGVGFQMHVEAQNYPPPGQVARNMRRLAELGLLVNISEMDVRIRLAPGDVATRLETQKRVYRELVGTCVAEPRCDGVTFWGFTDRYSWIDSFFGPDDPLLFDESYGAKPAAYGVEDALLRR
jgi:GH35 family endo-1,4-beta-xylanase